jgi:hypothetical protein
VEGNPYEESQCSAFGASEPKPDSITVLDCVVLVVMFLASIIVVFFGVVMSLEGIVSLL